MFVGLSACLSVFFLSATRHLSTLRRCLRVAERAGAVVAGGPARRAGNHSHREHARACRTTSQRKNRCADAFQKQNRTRARMLSYTSLPRFSKKGKKKTNMPLPKFSLQFAFSWSVYFSNRTESYSSQIEFAGPHGITENQATYLHLTQSRRLRHLNGESFRSVRQVISCCFTTRNFSWSESVGGLISSSNRAHGPRNCSQEGSRMFVGLSVGLSAFYRPHDICPLCGAASEYSESSRSRRRERPRAPRGQAHALARARARMPYNFSTKKSLR